MTGQGVQRVQRTWARAQETAEAARHRWDAVDTVFATRERDQRVVGSVLAGAVAFRLFVYLLPLFLTVVTLLGFLKNLVSDGPGDLGVDLGLSTYLVDSVDDAAEESSRSLWVLAPLTLWAVYTGGLGAAKVLRAVHALAWEQPLTRLRRGWLAALATFGFALVVGGVLAGLQTLRHRSEGLGIGFAALELAILVGLVLAANVVLPHDPAARWTDLLPGALLAGSGMWVLHLISVYALARRVESASELYGSLGVAAALLAWLYLLGRLLVASALLNSTLWERRRPTDRTTPYG